MEMLILGIVIGFTICWWVSKHYFAEQAEPIAMALGRERWRYLHTLRRELANRIMAHEPDGFVRLIKALHEETASVHKLTAEDRDAQRAELAKKYPKVADFDLIDCRDYILYDDAFEDYKLETIKQRYRDIIRYQALQLAADPLLAKAVWMSEVIDADWTIHDYAEQIKQRQLDSRA